MKTYEGLIQEMAEELCALALREGTNGDEITDRTLSAASQLTDALLTPICRHAGEPGAFVLLSATAFAFSKALDAWKDLAAAVEGEDYVEDTLNVLPGVNDLITTRIMIFKTGEES